MSKFGEGKFKGSDTSTTAKMEKPGADNTFGELRAIYASDFKCVFGLALEYTTA